MTLRISTCVQIHLTLTVYYLAVLSTCSPRECGVQVKDDELKSRSDLLRNFDMTYCEVDCMEESYIFASCHQSKHGTEKTGKTNRSSEPSNDHPNVLTKSCGSEVCNTTSQCVDDGCQRVCMEVASMCDLHSASKSGDLSKVNFILSHDQADLDCKDRIGRTPVMWAAGKGHIEVVQLLVTKGANLSVVDGLGVNTLHCACLGGDVEVVKYILSQDRVDINSRVRCGRTPVMLAAGNGHREVVEFLVRKGADVSLRDQNNNNILHLACQEGYLEVVEYIVSLGTVDINCRGLRKKTPIMFAGRNGHKGVVELLVKNGANLSLRDSRSNNILHFVCQGGHVEVLKYVLLQNTVDINSRGYGKKTPVMVAGRRGHKGAVELLVKNGADLSLKDRYGDNILHYASRGLGHVEVLKYVLSHNTEGINSRGYSKKTPIMVAGRWGHKNIVELFVKYGANMSLGEAHHDNILHFACRGGHVDVLKYVLSHNTEAINSRGDDNKTPVMAAGEKGHRDVVEFLVKQGANLSLIDAHSDNILHMACRGGHVGVVEYVLSLGTTDINSRGHDKRTPVMVAGRWGHEDIVELLVDQRANLSLSDARGHSILHLGCYGGHIGVLKYVLSRNTVDINSRGNDMKTPVMVAGEKGHRDLVELLFSHRANLSLRDARSDNILHLACRGGHVVVVEYLLSQGTNDINSRGNDNRTPVMVAGRWGHRDVIELLVDHRANLSLKDVRGHNILHLGCYGGHMEALTLVLSQTTVDINSRGNDNKTPAMVAGERGHRVIVELLVKHGANLSLRDDHSDNILHLACRRGHVDVVEYVLSLGTVDVNAKNDKGESASTIATTLGLQNVLDVLLAHGANI